MATMTAAARPQPASGSSRSTGKYALFAVYALMVLYVLQHNERFLINAADPIWQHYLPFKWWLLPHGIAGACAIFLGPMQFSDRLRQRYTKLHRVLGRIYVGGALIAAPLGAYIQYFEERMGLPRSFSIAGAVDAALWWTTTLVAFAFILKGNVRMHRQWMTRSLVVASVFLQVRVITGLMGVDNNPAAVETAVWSCLAFAVLASDVMIHWQELTARRAQPRGAVSGD